MNHSDTIVAPITALGGAVAIVRLTGPDSFAIAASVFKPWPEPVENRQAEYGQFVTGDDGLILPFLEGHGYTGEASVEMSVHGSRASVDGLIDACLRAGARLAEPGEFSLRAFLNGRIDLTQAEAVRDTVAAQTQQQLRFANAQRKGELSRRVTKVRDDAMKLLAAVEASVDFSEEIGEFDGAEGRVKLIQMTGELEDLLSTADVSRVTRHGLRIALIGAPNAGKSSLLNRLLGSDRAIVTPIPGTTRDTIEETVELGGIPCVLIDTAGLRETEDELEIHGIQRSLEAVGTSDMIWYIHDSVLPLPPSLPYYDLLVWNKADLASREKLQTAARTLNELDVSALTGVGVRELSDWIADRYRLDSFDVVVDPRHAPPLGSALDSVRQALVTIENDLPSDLLSVHLRNILFELGLITGEAASADMIDRIFHDFCIGK